jgi:8-amino-7-oxononanoate synthase
MNPLSWIDDELAALEAKILLRRLSSREGPQAARIAIDRHVLANFGSNDYLALAADPRLVRAATEAADRDGWGSGASPLVTGRADWHRRLEQRLAEFEGVEAAILFSSGFAANLGTIAALAGPGDAVYCDRKNHASLFDGCRLSRADVRVYPHNDCRRLAELLEDDLKHRNVPLLRKSSDECSTSPATACKQAVEHPGKKCELKDRKNHRRRLIVTDGLFSMDGDLAPLGELCDLAERFDAMLLVDEAHATGVFGPRGRGTAEHLGVEHRVHVRVGTLSKALGGVGGFVAGSRTLIEWLANRARPYVFSTAGPPAASAAAMAAIDIVQNEPHRRETLLARAKTLREELAGQGWNVGASAGQIIPIIVGDPVRALQLSAQLRERGLFVPAIRPPTVPEGEALLRISLTAGHTEEMIAGLLLSLGSSQGMIK